MIVWKAPETVWMGETSGSTPNFFNSSAVNGPIATIFGFARFCKRVFLSQSISIISKNAATDDALVKIIPSTLLFVNNVLNSFHCAVSLKEQTS